MIANILKDKFEYLPVYRMYSVAIKYNFIQTDSKLEIDASEKMKITIFFVKSL